VGLTISVAILGITIVASSVSFSTS
jgi:hypothetical protein